MLTSALCRMLGLGPRLPPSRRPSQTLMTGAGPAQGDEELVRRALQTIHSNSLLIVGEGDKTPLLIRLARSLNVLDDPEHAFFPVRVDLAAADGDDLFVTLAEQVLSQLEGELGDLQLARRPHRADGFRQLVRTLRRVIAHLARTTGRRPRVVLLLDNADRLDHLDPRVKQRLRSLFMRDLGGGLAAILAARRIDHHWDREGSPWFNFLEEISIGP